MSGEPYQCRLDGLRIQKVYANTAVEPEETSSVYDYNKARNDTTWQYGYDGQMCSWETYALNSGTGGIALIDLTRYGLGARGIDLISAKRVTSEIANDELMTAVTTDPVLGSTNERVSFPIYDGHGNTIATLSRAGTGYAVANEKHYDAWGKVRSDSGTGTSDQILNPDQRYCGNLGHKYDSTNGLIYMRARYYEAETGRFISEDPATSGDNWYEYCRNNSIGLVDKTGLDGSLEELEFSVNAQGELERADGSVAFRVKDIARNRLVSLFEKGLGKRASTAIHSLKNSLGMGPADDFLYDFTAQVLFTCAQNEGKIFCLGTIAQLVDEFLESGGF